MKINTEGRHASTENPAASGSSPCFLDTGINQRVINVPLTGIDFREIKRRPLARLSPERKMKAPETPLLLSKKKKSLLEQPSEEGRERGSCGKSSAPASEDEKKEVGMAPSPGTRVLPYH